MEAAPTCRLHARLPAVLALAALRAGSAHINRTYPPLAAAAAPLSRSARAAGPRGAWSRGVPVLFQSAPASSCSKFPNQRIFGRQRQKFACWAMLSIGAMPQQALLCMLVPDGPAGNRPAWAGGGIALPLWLLALFKRCSERPRRRRAATAAVGVVCTEAWAPLFPLLANAPIVQHPRQLACGRHLSPVRGGPFESSAGRAGRSAGGQSGATVQVNAGRGSWCQQGLGENKWCGCREFSGYCFIYQGLDRPAPLHRGIHSFSGAAQATASHSC